MTTAIIQNLEKMLASGKESALLRFSLGSEYLKDRRPIRAIICNARSSLIRRILQPGSCWARRCWPSGSGALAAYRQGIAVAENRGDKQAAKEMTVFARRIEKELGAAKEP